MMRFVLFPRLTLRGRRWFWHLKARNSEIIAQGHTRGYSREESAEEAIRLVMGSSSAVIEHRR